jgi:hypothetical protein
MRRILPGFLALILLSHSAQGQGCQGLSSFVHSPFQLTGDASLTGESNALGAGLGIGFPRGPFGHVAVANRSNQNFGGSSLDLAASAGYQVSMGQGSRIHVCPVLSAALGVGPNNAFNSGVDRSHRSAQLGVSVGAELTPLRRWNVIPTFAMSYAYQKDEATDNTGATLFQIDDYFTLIQLGVGVVFKSTLSLRPYVDLPLSLGVGDPTVGFTVGYSFGK